MSDVEQNRGHHFNWEVWGFMVELVKSLYPFHWLALSPDKVWCCILKKAQVTSNKYWLRLIIKILLTIFKSSGSIQERTTTAAPTTPTTTAAPTTTTEDSEERRQREREQSREDECKVRPKDCVRSPVDCFANPQDELCDLVYGSYSESFGTWQLTVLKH